MATLDVFRSSAFSTMNLSGMVEKVDYRPGLIGSLGLFENVPVRSRNVFVDRREGNMTLLRNLAAGEAPESLNADSRDAIALRTLRLAKEFTLYASEVDSIRAFGSETELEAAQAEVLRRAARIREDMALTEEFHMLAAVQGKLLDADGSTVIYDYHTEFGETAAAAVDFELATTSTDVFLKQNGIVRAMSRSARGSFTTGTTIHALCGDDFYDALTRHPSVKETYLNQQAANSIRDNGNNVFESTRLGPITYHNYRGTDDNSTVAIAPKECKFFPVGARDFFVKAMAPHEDFQYVNTPGRDVYAISIPDRDRNMWQKFEMYRYPLYICQRPGALRSAFIV